MPALGKENMKKITAYINTVRVHWLVEELEALGITEIMVTEYFSPSSKISRMELFARDDAVELVRESVHRVGTMGAAADHCFFIEEYDPGLQSQIPMGKRTSKLEESRIKQLINFMLRGSHRRIRSAFVLMTIGVLGVAAFIGLRTNEIQLTAKRTVETVRLLSEASSAMESGVLEEMLAVERFHRGEATDALNDFKTARVKVIDAVSDLEESQALSKSTFDVLTTLEHRFHLIAGGMFDIVERLSNEEKRNHQQERAETGYNGFAIPLAAGALYTYGILLSPALGAVLMSFSTVIVAINARFLKIEKSNEQAVDLRRREGQV